VAKKAILLVVDEKTKKEIRLFAKIMGVSMTRYLVGLHKNYGRDYISNNKILDPLAVKYWKRVLGIKDE